MLRLNSSHRFCSSNTNGKEVEADEEESADALAKTILKLQHDALEISSRGQPEKCAQARATSDVPLFQFRATACILR